MKNKERFKGITPEIAGQFGGGGSSTVAYDIVLRLDIESAASIGDVSKENIIIEYADWETIKEKARCGEGLNISLGCSEYNTKFSVVSHYVDMMLDPYIFLGIDFLAKNAGLMNSELMYCELVCKPDGISGWGCKAIATL